MVHGGKGNPEGSWAQWKRIHAQALKHPVGFEEQFVDRVLARVPGLRPVDVVPQYGFVDARGGRRRIDFMIVNTDKGYLLPIELDGASKDSRPGQWTDFLERQNAIVSSFHTLLRFSNLKMLNNAEQIVQEISEALAGQAAQKVMQVERQRVMRDLTAPAGSMLAEPGRQQPGAARASAEPARRSGLWFVVAVVLLGLLSLFMRGARHGGEGPPVTGMDLPSVVAAAAEPQAPPAAAAQRPVADRPAVIPVAVQAAEPPTLHAQRMPALPEDSAEDLRIYPRDTTPAPLPPAAAPSAADYLDSRDAAGFIGQQQVVCGRIAGVRRLSSGLFINFDRPYPNQTLTAVIWANHLPRVGLPNLVEGEICCVSGRIGHYQGKARMEISHRDQFVH